MKIENDLNYQLKLRLGCLLIGLLLVPQLVTGQIRAGVGYLKMLPGAREVAAAGTVAAALDYTYAFYANPGAAGFIREWQWSATYTNWISDIYNTSFLYGRKLVTPWSRFTKFLLGVNYLGIPEFTNSNQARQVVAGNSLLLTGSIGQPLGFLTNNLALGANVKYFNNKLAQFNADAFIFDVGLLYRTPRFHFQALSFGLFDWMILSSGVAVTNLGKPVQFIAEETPLPQTLRGGVALNLGRHRGLQFSLGLDYREIRDEAGYFLLGSEISWRQLLAFRMGYSWEDNLLGHFTFGGSIRLDEQFLTHSIFGSNNALRIELATNENNPVTDSPYHGTMTHQPQGPEKFQLLSPAQRQLVEADSVVLKWELTRDPDLFDAVNYRLFVDRDSARLANVLETATTNGISALAGLPLLVNQPLTQPHYNLSQLQHGAYFWAVLAYDLDAHVRFAEMQHRPIAKFLVTAPEPKVLAIDFDYSPWITTDDYQGILRVTIANVGNRTARNFTLLLSDKLEMATAAQSVTPQLFGEQLLPEIVPNDSFTFTTEWRTRQPGLHQIQAEITPQSQHAKVLHSYRAAFYTIPKGTFVTTDTVSIQEQFQTTYEFPYLGKIFFDSSRAEVPSKYIRDYVIEPPLVLFAHRLLKNPHVNISLQGTIDPNSGETDIALAQARAEAVRDTLQRLGVNPGQMTILPGRKLPPRTLPANPEDRRWVLEERRCVDITTDEALEVLLFSPLHSAYFEKTNVPMYFDAQVVGVVPFRTGAIQLAAPDLNTSTPVTDHFIQAQLTQKISWQLSATETETGMNKAANYSLAITDSLQRNFTTRPQPTFLTSILTGSEYRFYMLAQFGSIKAVYHFCWENLLKMVRIMQENPKLRMRFYGHGCAIGPASINQPLSQNRAFSFQNKFLEAVKGLDANAYPNIKSRNDTPEGRGEADPFTFKTADGRNVLLGDNQTPLGRLLNRRVMIYIYRKRWEAGESKRFYVR